MEMLTIIILFITGLILIIKGGDWFVDAAIWIASVTGMSPILIGATIVSLATTMPELFVSTIASIQRYPDLAIGNAIGSTICNIGLVLAISLIFKPINFKKSGIYAKTILMIGATIILIYFSSDMTLMPYEGIILLSIFVVYILINIKEARANSKIEKIKNITMNRPNMVLKDICINLGKFLFGIIFIIVGSRLLVQNGSKIGELLNIPQQVIGVTIIAFGTSLPELTTTIAAIVKGHHGISLGNIIGANILNMTMILGTSALVTNNGIVISSRNIDFLGTTYKNIPQALSIDMPMALAIMFILILPTLFTINFKRWHGGSLLAMYLIYISFLVSISF